jgi:hypothetical protein
VAQAVAEIHQALHHLKETTVALVVLKLVIMLLLVEAVLLA